MLGAFGRSTDCIGKPPSTVAVQNVKFSCLGLHMRLVMGKNDDFLHFGKPDERQNSQIMKVKF